MGDRKASRSSPAVAGTLKAAVRGLSLLPLPVARGLGHLLGSALWWLPNQFRSASVRNVERCFPELEAARRRQIVRRSLASTGLNVAEAGAMFHWSRERLMALEEEVVGAELIASALARGQGVIVLGPHVGNWEFLSHAIGVRWGLVALYRPPRIAELDTYIRESRQHLEATELVPADRRGLRRVAETLRAGRVVGILPDQEPLKSHGVFAPFFGIPALTMTLVGKLARRFDAAVFFGAATRAPTGRFRVRFTEVPAGVWDADPQIAAAALNLEVEQCAREYPEQYTWSYRRFKTRPPAELAAREVQTTAAS